MGAPPFSPILGERVGTSFSDDGMGNVTNDGANTYSYDAEGRQVTVNSTTTLFDAFNRPMEIHGSSGYTDIVYAPDGSKFALMNGATVQKYMVPMAAGMQAVYGQGSGNFLYYRHADWLGSSRFAATSTGSMYYDAAYAPFGENYAEKGTTDRSFTGQTQDTASGLNDFLFRQQSAAQGRWLVPDPAGLAAVDITNPQTWNRYAYVGNNPLNATDPLGLYCAIDVDGGIIGGCTEGDGIWIGGLFFPWWLAGGGGSGGGGGGHPGPPSGGGTPPPSQPPAPQPVNFPNETLGIPNGLNLNFGGPLGAILPSAVCGDLGPCPMIGNSIVGVDDAVEISALTYLVGLTIYAIEKYGPPLIQTIRDATREVECEGQSQSDLRTCRKLANPAARSRCYESATNRKNRCLDGWDPLPPLITW